MSDDVKQPGIGRAQQESGDLTDVFADGEAQVSGFGHLPYR
jgi:hypothetical protein